MDRISTKYGVLEGISMVELYEDDSIKECKLLAYNEIKTIHGTFIPQYEEDEVRRKYTNSLSFYEEGNLKSISLNKQERIVTTIGIIPAEKIVFYKSGSIKRIFPLNGKLSGFWSEENEYEMAEEIDFKFPFGEFRKKIIGIYFYESGGVKSITFWPGDYIDIKTSIGEISIQTGISLYENGELKSIEPKNYTLVETAIGRITAFNTDILGIHGDSNSLSFFQNGKLKALSTPTDYITITAKTGKQITMKPTLKQNIFDNSKMDIVPLHIEFEDNTIRFNNYPEKEYKLEENTFELMHYPLANQDCGGSCADCKACGQY